jgi:hypothetical protein
LPTVALVGSAFAQGADAPKSRADVKAETRAAEKAGKLVPAGEGPIAPTPSRQSNTTRAQRKADTLHARKAGELESTGEASDAKAERAEQARPRPPRGNNARRTPARPGKRYADPGGRRSGRAEEIVGAR